MADIPDPDRDEPRWDGVTVIKDIPVGDRRDIAMPVDEFVEQLLKAGIGTIDRMVEQVNAGDPNGVFQKITLLNGDQARSLLAVAVVTMAADREAAGDDDAKCDRCGAPAVECIGGTDYACAGCLDQVAADHAAPCEGC